MSVNCLAACCDWQLTFGRHAVYLETLHFKLWPESCANGERPLHLKQSPKLHPSDLGLGLRV